MSESLQAYEKRLAELVKQHEARAEKVVPELYKLLREAKQEPKEARATLEHDLTRLWKLDTIQRYLPDEAKNAEMQELRSKRTEKQKPVGMNPTKEIAITNDGSQEVTIANAPSEPYSPGAKPDRNATYTEKQAFKIQELGASLKTALAENAELKKHVDKSGYNADVTQELLDAQVKIKELEEGYQVNSLVEVAGQQLPVIVFVRPSAKSAKVVVDESAYKEMYA